MPDKPDTARARLRIVLSTGEAIGPGKADLLQAISATGSIAAAGRRMGMSYKRAWSLVDSLNACFSSPLVETTRGGSEGGGARLTEMGREILDAYRNAEQRANSSAAPDLRKINSLVRPDHRR